MFVMLLIPSEWDQIFPGGSDNSLNIHPSSTNARKIHDMDILYIFVIYTTEINMFSLSKSEYIICVCVWINKTFLPPAWWCVGTKTSGSRLVVKHILQMLDWIEI